MSFFAELKRRNVFRVGIAYLVAAWLLMQIADVVLGNIAAPEWVFQVLMLFLAIGLPIAVIFAWAFEMTPEGLKRERDVDRSASITKNTGRKLDRVIIGVLAIAVIYFAADKWLGSKSSDAGDKPATALEKSIAVLPFSNRSSLTDDIHFVDGMHDDILTRLSKLPSLDKVISRTSTEQYRDTDKPMVQIGQELGVASILEGGVQRAGDRVRINMQLINAETDEHLWAETYDRELTIENLFAIQSEVAAEVARALDAVLSEEDKQRLESMPTSNLDAYNEYVLGRQEAAKRTAKAIAKALAHFEKAIELDPDYALAYVGVADSHALRREYAGVRKEDTFAPRREAIDKALDLDPLSGEAFAALGLLQLQQGDRVAAEESFLKAIDLSPNYATAYHWYANLLVADELSLADEERREEALRMLRKALSLDPAAPILTSNLAAHLRMFGRIEEAQATLLDGLKRNPDFPGFYANMASLLVQQGRIGEAAAWHDEAVRLNASNVGQRVFQCYLQVELDDPVAAQACLDDLRRDFPQLPESSLAGVRSAIYSLSGKPQMAVEYMERLDRNGPDQQTKGALAGAYIRNAEWSKARPVLEEFVPHFYSEDEVTVSQQEVNFAIAAAVTMREDGGWSRRAHYLCGEALETMMSMHRTRGVGYGINDVNAYAIRGEYSQMIAALRQAIDDGWRWGWWGLRGRDYQVALQERPLQPEQQSEWDALIAELEADIAKQRQWYVDHKDDPLF
jgi:TolB-like protein/Tfp pilus assembly protein PilF